MNWINYNLKTYLKIKTNFYIISRPFMASFNFSPPDIEKILKKTKTIEDMLDEENIVTDV